MKNILIVIFFFSCCIFSGYSQTVSPRNIPENLLLQNKEEVFIHYNSTFLLAGENLYYTFYSLDADTGELKDLSKLGYVELTGQDGSMIFRHQLALENGRGYGDFLIPATIPSGAYKVIGYTRWMLNAGKDHFFEGDLVIINPYLEDQSQIQIKDDNVSEVEIPENKNSENIVLAPSGSYSLFTSKDIYKKRENGIVKIVKLNTNIANGSFSLSIKKLEEYETPEAISATTYKEIYQNPGWGVNSNPVLPDLRGQLVSGKIIREDGGDKLAGRNLVFSIPGESFFVRIAKTAPDGSFSFNMDTKNFGNRAFLQVMGDTIGDFKILLDELPEIARENLESSQFTVSPSMAELIRQRSIYNQVENSYSAVKQDSVIPEVPSFPFYGTLPEVYNLDDFTRFPTLQETFVEIIEMSRIRKMRDGSSRIELLGQGGQEIDPLLIVDGIIVQDHEDLVHYDARKIKSIGLQREEYYLGPEVFNGMIVVETVNGDFSTTLSHDYIKSFEIKNVLPKKSYFHQTYSEQNKNSRIPDYRVQLLWEPDLEIKNPTKEIEFSTSDVSGYFEINLEGFSDNGEPVSLRKVIKVE